MKKYLLKFFIGLSATLALALLVSTSRCSYVTKDRNRISSNQRSLMEGITFYQTKDSLNAASIEQLTLTVGELKGYFPELKKDIENLNISLRRVEAASQTATEQYYEVSIPVRDSVFIRDTVELKVRCIDYDNTYVHIHGCNENGTFKGSIRSVDTLVQVVHRVPKKFWFIKWGTKAIRQEVISKNPYSKIVYTEYITLKK